MTAGEKLPSTRSLAKDLNISQSTVLEAYSQLMAEGYLLRSNKVCVYPIENYAFQNSGNHENEILLGYAHLELEAITAGIRQLSDAIHSI